MVVSIRRFVGDQFLPELLDAAAPKKTWFKSIDNYHTYLDSNSDEIKSDLNSSFLAKFLAYIEAELQYQPVLHAYASRISALRNNYSSLLTYGDSQFLLSKIQHDSFPTVFRQFLTELNNHSDYLFEDALIEDSVRELIKLLQNHHPDHTLFIIVG